jgi:hypothetical protein
MGSTVLLQPGAHALAQPPFHAHSLRNSSLRRRRARRSRPLRSALLPIPATVRSFWSAPRRRTWSSRRRCLGRARGAPADREACEWSTGQHGFPFVSSRHGRQLVAPRCCPSTCDRRRPSVAGIDGSTISSAQPSPPWSGSGMLALGHGAAFAAASITARRRPRGHHTQGGRRRQDERGECGASWGWRARLVHIVIDPQGPQPPCPGGWRRACSRSRSCFASTTRTALAGRRRTRRPSRLPPSRARWLLSHPPSSRRLRQRGGEDNSCD